MSFTDFKQRPKQVYILLEISALISTACFDGKLVYISLEIGGFIVRILTACFDGKLESDILLKSRVWLKAGATEIFYHPVK